MWFGPSGSDKRRSAAVCAMSTDRAGTVGAAWVALALNLSAMRGQTGSRSETSPTFIEAKPQM